MGSIKLLLLIGVTVFCCQSCALPTKNTQAPLRQPGLRAELLKIKQQDQFSRKTLDFSKSEHELEAMGKGIAEIDKKHCEQLKNIVRDYGWPTPNLIGDDGVHAFWLVIQHCPDREFQEYSEPHFERLYKQGDFSSQNYALLVDRIRSNNGKAQIYGTQAVFDGKDIILNPVDDLQNLDARRSKLGMMPIADYMAMMKDLFLGVENKDNQSLNTNQNQVKSNNSSDDFGISMEVQGDGQGADMTIRFISIIDIEAGSLADASGLVSGDLILSVNDIPVKGARAEHIQRMFKNFKKSSLQMKVMGLDGDVREVSIQ